MSAKSPGTRKTWDTLSPGHRKRLARHGVTRESYDSGAPLPDAARGHAKTPEHPKEARRNPKKYHEYLDRKPQAGAKFPALVETDGEEPAVASHDGWRRADKSVIAKHWNALRKYRDFKGDDPTSVLRPFENVEVGGNRGVPTYVLETRTDVIRSYLNRQTEDRFESIYQYAASITK